MFVKERSIPYKNTMSIKLYHFPFGKLVDPEISTKILKSFYKVLTGYLTFWEERYLQKCTKLGGTIKYFIVPRSIPKTKTEKKDISRVSPKNATKQRRKLIQHTR